MKLSQVIAGLPCHVASGAADPEIADVVYDSRRVSPGALFIALPGKHVDGQSFIADAVARGAAAVVARAEASCGRAVLVHAEDPARVMAGAAAALFRHPDRDGLLVGVTGTNGKTTITYLLESVFAAGGLLPGVMGTIAYRWKDTLIPAPNTTPQSADVFRLLRAMIDDGVRAVAMEVSSHALALGRVSGVEFDIAVFTNLTRDHLDFHGTMEDYFAAKARLFMGLAAGTKRRGKCAIINVDDPWAPRFIAAAGTVPVLTYGTAPAASVRARDVAASGTGTAFTLVAPQGTAPVTTPLLGMHNVHNILAAAAAGVAAGIPFPQVVDGIQRARPVPGRLERVDAGQPFTVVVDYAHTDDALANVLAALRALSPRRIITVFGCGGDRDRSKRPVMGDTATALSDLVIVTSDNPRSEDPTAIALDIEVGIRRRQRSNYRVELDRAQAIEDAIAQAGPGDIVLLAGKGHENYQIIGERTVPFNDVAVARAAIEKKHGTH